MARARALRQAPIAVSPGPGAAATAMVTAVPVGEQWRLRVIADDGAEASLGWFNNREAALSAAAEIANLIDAVFLR